MMKIGLEAKQPAESWEINLKMHRTPVHFFYSCDDSLSTQIFQPKRRAIFERADNFIG
jgi:hypothetical protein